MTGIEIGPLLPGVIFVQPHKKEYQSINDAEPSCNLEL